MTRHLLRQLGLSANEPVQSPTFTYFNEYQIRGQLYLHMDLYRCEEPMRVMDLLGRDLTEYAGFFIEWFDHLPSLVKDLGRPSHELSLELSPRSDRERKLRFVSPGKEA